MKKIQGEHLDTLKMIERAIMEVYQADRTLLDMDVKNAIDTLVRHYHSEEEERKPGVVRLGARAGVVFAAVQKICEGRLGRSPDAFSEFRNEPLSLSTLVACLR